MSFTDAYTVQFTDQFGRPAGYSANRQRAIQAYYDAILSPLSQIYRRLDIYEADGTTPFALNVPIEDGSVSVDQGRQGGGHWRLASSTTRTPGS